MTFMMIYFRSRGQGARVSPKANNRKWAWLKQLKVAISTRASVPIEQGPQNSWNKFLSTYARIPVISKLVQKFTKSSWNKTLGESFQISKSAKFCMQNGKVGESDVFSQQKCLYCLDYIQNFNQVSLHYIKNPKSSIRQFNYVAWVATIAFYNVTGISKVELVSDRAKGLCLQNLRRTWSRSSRTVILTKKKEHRKIEAIYRKIKRNFKPKSEKSRSGWVSLNSRQASPLTTIFPWWIRKDITSCVGPPYRTCAG
jgi:hypothetical protein